LNNLPDTRTRHSRNSKPSTTSYLRVRRVVDKEDFALNSAPLWDRGRDTSCRSRPGTLSFTALKGLFPLRAPCARRPSTYHQLSIIIPRNPSFRTLRGAVTSNRPIRAGGDSTLRGSPAHFLNVARTPRVPCRVPGKAGLHAGVFGGRLEVGDLRWAT